MVTGAKAGNSVGANSVDLSAFVGSRIRLFVQAADAGRSSLVEAGIDHVVVEITR